MPTYGSRGVHSVLGRRGQTWSCLFSLTLLPAHSLVVVKGTEDTDGYRWRAAPDGDREWLSHLLGNLGFVTKGPSHNND